MNELIFQTEEQGVRALVCGVWDKNSVSGFEQKPFKSDYKRLIFDFSRLEHIDTAGIRYFLALQYDLQKLGIEVKREYLKPNFQTLFDLCEKNYLRILPAKKGLTRINFFVYIGEQTLKALAIFKRFLIFVGMIFTEFFHYFKHPRDFRFISFLYHIQHSALNASGIIVITSLLVGVVLAYQAAYQLAQFGANILIVDLVGIAATREIAPLIAAIVIAGRSASSYTAQIGVMKITDEIAAMNTMGFSSARFVIMPRIMALALAMPLIVALADGISIFGGMLVAQFSLDVNFVEFIRRFKEAVALKHIIIGLIKAPVFGFLIATIACFRGFEVKDTTESIGIYTTKSVVEAIFWVIAFDALFSIFLTQLGI
ncbi:ABC transporter permease [Campylobacter sp. MIT 99-7217]|uniref:ABC transporter permease n=1 Tax=Campylobacter sp. MIT 99-7217 TaxID=535091 RepID=UPI00115832D1|nr:ABC transporter permease [Campylobacter sp. MIT 99-7217]TQR32356.1 ABC transporter permease [Campylobacter sp. MIT 99-7217]